MKEPQLPGFQEIQACLRSHQPILKRTAGKRCAATALIFHPSHETPLEILLIERSRRTDDPWSGHFSLPGGHPEPQDGDLAATARREAWEEVGIELGAPLGRLDDIETTGGTGAHVSPFIFAVESPPHLQLDSKEVHQALWIPVSWILNPRSAHTHRSDRHGQPRGYPAVRYQGNVIWGLTYRTLENFFRVLGYGLPRAEV
ncbi:MAG: CoA pyrophosphatase [Planctomycetota bacterium]